MEAIASWVEALPGDVEVVKAVVEAEGVPREARKLAAGGLCYLVTRLDLIPDWNETIGIIDDTMVVRVCLALGAAPPPGLAEPMRARLGALIEDVEVIKAFLGARFFSRLRRHCTHLVDTVVHGYSPARVVDQPVTRAALYAAVEADLARMPAASFSRPDDVERRLRSYLQHKLQR
jgi:uncharacterized membrane protein YkvA (DUF1232 family)